MKSNVITGTATVEVFQYENVMGKLGNYMRVSNEQGFEHVMEVGEATVKKVGRIVAGEKDEPVLTNKVVEPKKKK